MGRRKPIPAAAKQATRRDKGTSSLLLCVTGSVLANIPADKSKSTFPAGSMLAEHIQNNWGGGKNGLILNIPGEF